VVWATGPRPSPLASALGAPTDALGRVVVDGALRVPARAAVLAAGDVARAMTDGEHATLMSCQHALSTGIAAGENAARLLLGLDPLAYAPPPYQTCLDLGGWGACYSRGWDRVPLTTGAEAKELKRTINTRWIYPPVDGDREAVLDAGRPAQYRRRR
jgi:NADH dehydrogenase